MTKRALVLAVLCAAGCFGQFYPTGAHVNLYFPHLADGGPASQLWQTSFKFVNPSSTMTANVSLKLFQDDGFPLNLDLGAGPLPVHTFAVPPGGSVTLKSTAASANTVTGRAVANSDIPMQGTVLFRSSVNGIVSVEVTAPPTLPTARYLSPATSNLGIALANISGAIKNFQVAAVDASGTTLSTTQVNVPGLGHKSFNLFQVFPSLPGDFNGSVVITPQVAGDQVVAWTLNSDGRIISTLPTGPLEWPISHPDRIQLVFQRLLAAAPVLFGGLGGVNLSLQSPPNLVISSTPEVNAFATSTQTVQINLALSELVSDSPSELAFLMAHDLAHIAQYRSGANTIILPNTQANREADADLVGMILLLNAGFDPYGAGGAMGKLSMANASPGLVSPFFDGLSDGTAAFSTARINSMVGVITQACGYVNLSGFCGPYKTAIHPDFPGSAPL